MTTYIQNEVSHFNAGVFTLQHGSILSYTLAATLYIGEIPVQTINDTDFGIVLNDIGSSPSIFRLSDLNINYETGVLTPTWIGVPLVARIIVNYQYENEKGIRVGNKDELLIRKILTHVANEDSSVAKCFLDIVKDCPQVEKIALEVWNKKFKVEPPWKQ